jgi:transposase
MGFNSRIFTKKKATGRPRVDNRKLLNGIIYILKTGCRWQDLPSIYGNGKTAYRRFQEYEKLKIFKKINQILLKKYHKQVNLKKNINR